LAALGRILARTVRLRLTRKFVDRHRAAKQVALGEIHPERLPSIRI
jgi:hypothetical protein